MLAHLVHPPDEPVPAVGLVLLNGDGGGQARHERNSFGHVCDLEPHRHALGESHPGVNRIDARQALCTWRRIGHANAARDRVDTPDDRVIVAKQARLSDVADADVRHFRLLEIAVDPVAVGVYYGHVGHARTCIVPDAHQQVGHVAVYRTSDFGSVKVDLGLRDLGLCGLERTLGLSG